MALHKIDSERDVVPMKTVIMAVDQCFERLNLFTKEVVAFWYVQSGGVADCSNKPCFCSASLQRMSDLTPIPMLLLRSTLKSLKIYPALKCEH